MLKNRVAAAAASAALAVASLSLAAPANAAPADATSAQAAGCSNRPIKAKESVNIRKKPTATATAVGLFPKGANGCYDSGMDGQKYNVCGKKSTVWSYITYKGMKGWVAEACVKFV
ncbi:SH3 domain-containing protein [Streptomyces tuirus]|uniref:SH3 domain-containing protein n=1 Tax=Streptomyces tuirus TaxID=68278 RepID=A0A941J3G6_9ACTN|nr:SH3 domain-containing protein [Streptomyces tuirus]